MVYHMMYGSWDNERDRQTFLSFCIIFCPFTPQIPPLPKNPQNQNFEKKDKRPGDIIILYMCTINDSPMIYNSGDNECNEQNFLSFWATFCTLTPLKSQKIKIFKKWKIHLKISWFYTNVTKIMIICYTVPEIRCMTDVIFGLIILG